MALGHSSEGIGKLIHISEETVKYYRKSIIVKLDARNGTHAVAIGIVNDLI